MTVSLLCLLEGVVGLAIVCLLLYVLYWAATSLVAAFGIPVPAPVFVVLKVIAVLLVVIFIVRAIMLGEVCGWFGLARLGR